MINQYKHNYHYVITIAINIVISSYRNWPRYGLRWSGLCCHSRHSTGGAGRRAAGPTSAVPGVAAQTTPTQTVSWSISILPRKRSIHNDKSHDDHDDEPPCWNVLAGNAIVMMKASIDTVSEYRSVWRHNG